MLAHRLPITLIASWGYVTTIESFGINYLQKYRYPAIPLVCEIKLRGIENQEDATREGLEKGGSYP